MDITYLGHSSFKIKTKSAAIVTDPFDSQMVGFKFPTVEADIVTVSHQHKDHNAVDQVKGVKKIVEGPGEYEISGVSIIGYPSFHDDKSGKERGKNTVYVFEADGLRIVHLGDLGIPITDDFAGKIGEVDVLMIPVGGFYTIGPKDALSVTSKIDPYYVIPMHYKATGMKDEFSKLEPVDTYLKETNMAAEKLPKFSIKKDDIMDDQSTKVIVLECKS